MNTPYTLFEVSWEVCNKVGGIHTVLSTKAKTMVEKLGDDYVAVGPWRLSDEERHVVFDEEPEFAEFAESCRRAGVPVRVGRWRIPGRPRTILVEFSALYDERDGVLSGLWEDYAVDSIHGEWDYVEPVLFGHAAGRVIERWWEEYVVPRRRRAVAHANEWLTGSALLYLKQAVPSMGTVFTAHATMLGRELSSLGHSPDDGLGDETVEELAKKHKLEAKHSLEGVVAREADVFTTVSEITAKEAELLHERAPDPILPNGIELDVIDELAGETNREEARSKLLHMASRFLGENVGDAALLCITGRYEFHNKGMDLLLDSLARLEKREGRRIVLFVLVPAGNSGVRSELLERLEGSETELDGPLGISTHNLFDAEHDPVHEHMARLGMDNAPDSRVKVIQVPIYLDEDDGLLDLPYEAVLRAMDLSVFPSYYEPWGYTPQESLALGVPTITTDYAGFGRWARTQDLRPEDGVTVLERVHREYEPIVEELVTVVQEFLERSPSAKEVEAACRKTAARTAWSDLIANYDTAYQLALDSVQERLESGVPQSRRPLRKLSVQPTPEGQKPRLHSFDVSATLPPALEGLKRLARNYWWCWDPEAQSLFEELSPISWAVCDHNPFLFLKRVYPEDLDAKAADVAFVAKIDRVLRRFDDYLAQPIDEGEWRSHTGDDEPALTADRPVAYFCAEYGIHESLRVYSGGLGILAGDHLKSASDLNLPFVAIGLFYRYGYMTQRLSPTGEQIPVDVENDPRTLPLERVREADGKPLQVRLQLPGRELFLGAWRVRVGRIPLYLLDANLPVNRPEDRDITRNLYGGDNETRLQQEIVLGRGGVRLLRQLGIEPGAYHMNEGHAAFLNLERGGVLATKEGLTAEEAREYVRATSLFTTHTPVPAGHDRFAEDLIRRYFSDVGEWAGIPWERFFALGHAEGDDGSFNMTYLALALSSCRNGVSVMHGEASRRLLHGYWPGLLESEVPVRSVTNGIHLPTWTHPSICAALGVEDRPVRGADFAAKASAKATNQVWKAKQELKRRLLDEVRTVLKRSFLERGDSPIVLNEMLDGLREDALLICFARRFAPYKRAHLIFQDTDRLRAILDDSDRPVRILVAGKAHPADTHGKDILKGIAEVARQEEFVGRVFFVEDYDIALARLLVQGVDVWLNNPTRMLEASGTSGMKAAANGALNLSIGDGWWPEAYDGENGWLIAEGRMYEDQGLQDQFDSSVLYRLLEEEVVPRFFERGKNGLPARWLEMVRHDLATIPPVFNTDRMVTEYLTNAYLPLAANHAELSQGRKWKVKSLVQRQQRIRKGFEGLEIVSATVADPSGLKVGDRVDVKIEVRLGALRPEDVVAELVLGHSRDGSDLESMIVVPLAVTGTGEDGSRVFEGVHEMERSGSFAYGIRVRANGDGEGGESLRNLVLWA